MTVLHTHNSKNLPTNEPMLLDLETTMANDSFTNDLESSATQTQDGEALDLQDFQARLETSIGNIQAMVDSWLPKELQTKSALPSESAAPLDLNFSRPRNSKLGLGSSAPKQPPSRLTTSKLYSQLTKKAKNEGEAGKPVGQSSAINHKEVSDEEEDSRTSTLSKKRPAPPSNNPSSSFSLLQQPPKKACKLAASLNPSSSLHEAQNPPSKRRRNRKKKKPSSA
ncbi:hypothetical protein PTTG_03489 [Puccinia triticina 1-1 BBBD Race 1]|uniref:Uncharacterized protein n=2 Tax=Puccinia triticina TaxID=208348 RepID=A0A180GIJ3_PUCT1|nr:uncharacterized protein PtA15_18A74 [Puccinia triticina]OAV92520.1 hypothetical protein PTTG_03489 [Puccinia triticina 1-1 BBBD Race 1]WAQ93018.1 hypothetical protein PtA15_18A74 [Puccinia triticina]WAR63000.1 hypothetical protein PtB15_18B82 [Puccinia triticina]